MPEYTEEKVIGHRDVLPDGQIQIREDTYVKKDGVVISLSYHRYVLYPGQPYSELEESIQRICRLEHTAEVIEAFQAAQAAARDAAP